MSKKPHEEQPSNHPFMGSLVRKMDKITECFVFRDFDAALRGMFAVFYSLRSEDKVSPAGKELYLHLQKARNGRNSVQDTDPLVWKNKIMYFDASFEEGYEQLFDGLNEILWRGGYFSDELYKQAISLAGDNVSGKKPSANLPGIMSSRLE
jgi:hypothetical protein